MTTFLAPAGLLCALVQGPALPAPAAACTPAAYRQFDFWIGEWDVTNQQPPAVKPAPASKSRITSILNGCAVLEEYETASGYAGKSLNFHDGKAGKWHQVWIDNGGTPLFLQGGMQGKSMVMQDKGAPRSAPGGTRTRAPHGGLINRITWSPMEGGRVRQHWETSKDAGRTWQTSFDGVYAPRAR